MLCYRGLPDRLELEVGFLFNNDIAGNIEEFYSIHETVVGLVMKLNKRYKLAVVQACAPTSSDDNQLVEGLYKDVESAINKVKTQHTVLMGDFSAKVGKKQDGDQALGEYGIGSTNSKGSF